MPDVYHCPDCEHRLTDCGDAGVESDSLRVKATALAVQLTGWMEAPVGSYHYPEDDPLIGVGSQLAEWCRSARDVLEAVGRG